MVIHSGEHLDLGHFYAPEAHIVYLTVSSSFLKKFCNGGERPEQAIKFLYSPAPPPPTVWTLDLPTIHPVKVTRGLVCIKQPMHL
jgi:hypothetical protein